MQEEKLQDAHKFKRWKEKLVENNLKINGVEEVYTRRNHNGEVLFSTLMLDAVTPEGHKIPPICFLKGDVVCILVCLIDAKTKEKYLLLVRQRRIASGELTYEHPAGMVDGTKTAVEICVQEVFEETGINITEDQLLVLSKGKPYYPSTGTSDEAMFFFACELEMTKTEIEAFENQQHGTNEEHEFITTHVLSFQKAHRLINNTNGLLLNYLYLQEVGDFKLMSQLSL
ncbi:NUDIX hydrolase [Jiulongibacter sediminis]|jgi:8-oxo-dGTP pyrophosphatase MutT (NUDIX family)|uniref:NUDIX hydrolase n=1 Tax=Jiulongibacter sediminis TaxID=1605367 RepID=UPI0026F10893|nr:NUDIX hydrolase [Jiulongibacter sediminis]